MCARTQLRCGDIYALVVIPNHLERDARQGTQPQVTVFNNGQFIPIAKLVNSARRRWWGPSMVRWVCWRRWPTAKRCPVRSGSRCPSAISSQMTALYNLNSSYAQFLLSAILSAVWQILVVRRYKQQAALARQSVAERSLSDAGICRSVAP